MLNCFERVLVVANRWVLILLLLAMSCIVFANVVLRYTTGDSIVWAEEVARHMMIWVTFLGAGLVLRFGGHVAIDNFHQAVGEQGACVVRAIVALGLGAFFFGDDVFLHPLCLGHTFSNDRCHGYSNCVDLRGNACGIFVALCALAFHRAWLHQKRAVHHF